MTETIVATRPGRRWLTVAMAGCGMVVLTLITTAMVIVDKTRFGSLVGPAFLPVIGFGVIAGSILLLVAAWNLPERGSWRGVTLLIWGLVALTSPAFGMMFLLPWGFLALTFPVVVAAFVGLNRRRG